MQPRAPCPHADCPPLHLALPALKPHKLPASSTGLHQRRQRPLTPHRPAPQRFLSRGPPAAARPAPPAGRLVVEHGIAALQRIPLHIKDLCEQAGRRWRGAVSATGRKHGIAALKRIHSKHLCGEAASKQRDPVNACASQPASLASAQLHRILLPLLLPTRLQGDPPAVAQATPIRPSPNRAACFSCSGNSSLDAIPTIQPTQP